MGVVTETEDWIPVPKLIDFVPKEMIRLCLLIGVTESGLNSSHPPPTTIAAYMRQWIGSALVQLMACRLFGAKPISKPTVVFFVNCTIRNKLQWNFNQNTKLFIHENAYENIVCEMAPILFRGRCVKMVKIVSIGLTIGGAVQMTTPVSRDITTVRVAVPHMMISER